MNFYHFFEAESGVETGNMGKELFSISGAHTKKEMDSPLLWTVIQSELGMRSS